MSAPPHDLRLRGVDPRLPAGLARRVWARDPSAWAPGEDNPAERLGWLDLPHSMGAELAGLRSFAAGVAEVADIAVLLGMGGSSLAPEMFSRTYGSVPGRLSLVVLDSTHPEHVRSVTSSLDPLRSFFLVSSKSGTTLETLSLYRHFRALADDGSRFAAITDPGSPLEELAGQEGFRHVFLNPPDLGGRYSGLSLFGLVPAALIGLDLEGLLASAAGMAEAVGPDVPEDENPGTVLGAAVGQLADRGRNKLTFLISDSLAAFGDWVEQLLAESTGKRGTGVVPVVDEPPSAPEGYSDDRAFVHLALEGDDSLDERTGALAGAGHPVLSLRIPDRLGLGGQMFLWEFATAVAGSVLGINPFDQPDVESAKRATRRVLEERGVMEWAEEDPEQLFGDPAQGDYAALLAFAAATPERAETIRTARERLLAERRIATTGAFGPRYLHSTGQLHKGGPAQVRAAVILDPPSDDLPIPGRAHGFGRLVHAQAVGDAHALRDAGRPVARTTWDRFERWAARR